MAVHLTPENEAFITAQIASGVFATRDEALGAGIQLMRKREELRHRIVESRRQLDEGQFTEYDDSLLQNRLIELKELARKFGPSPS